MPKLHEKIQPHVYAACTLTLTLLFVGVVAPACGSHPDQSSGGGSGSATGGGSGTGGNTTGPADCKTPTPDDTPVDPDASCLSGDTCAADGDCPNGHRCNDMLSPPGCQKLYCGGAFTLCSDNVFCEEGLQCGDGVCSTCDLCGTTQCFIDFSTDVDHCGCCNSPAPPGGVCNGGVPGCAPDQSLCPSGACANLSDDPQNCGTCGVALPNGVDCVNGAPACGSNKTLCGDKCVELAHDDANCGSCGAVCLQGGCAALGNLGPSCLVESSDLKSCTQVCKAAGMSCVDGQLASYEKPNTCDQNVYLDSCNQVPEDFISCFCGACTFSEISCWCAPKQM